MGTEVQRPHGRVDKKIKTLDGAKWVSRGRHNYMQAHKVELEPNQRVFHVNGDVADDRPSNLAAIRFSNKRYDLKRSRVVWAPKVSLGLPQKFEGKPVIPAKTPIQKRRMPVHA